MLDPSERALLLTLCGWPEAVAEVEARRRPHRVAAYLTDLARDTHAPHHRRRVVGQPPDVVAFPLDLLRATRTVIAWASTSGGVAAPGRM